MNGASRALQSAKASLHLRSYLPERLRRQRGFNLVELLVAVAIGGLLLTGAISIFVNNQQVQRATSQLARLQEDARYALDLMVYDLRMAGFVGCSDDPAAVKVISDLPTPASRNVLWNLTTPIEGIDDTTVAATAVASLAWFPSNLISQEALPANLHTNSDLITLRYVNGTVEHEIAPISPGFTNELVIDKPTDFAELEIVAAHDCGGADVFYVSDIETGANPNDNKIIASQNLRPYDKGGSGSQVSKLVGVRYYVATDPNTGIPGLYRREILDRDAADKDAITETEPSSPIIEGVEMMQLLYGVDTNSDNMPDKFVEADSADLGANAALWREVVAVQVSMLLRTSEGLQQGDSFQAASYQVGSQTYTPTSAQQQFQFRTFQTTVFVRNLR